MSSFNLSFAAPGPDAPVVQFRLTASVLPPVGSLVWHRGGAAWRVTGHQFRVKAPNDNGQSNVPPWSAVEEVIVTILPTEPIVVPTKQPIDSGSMCARFDVMEGILDDLIRFDDVNNFSFAFGEEKTVSARTLADLEAIVRRAKEVLGK